MALKSCGIKSDMIGAILNNRAKLANASHPERQLNASHPKQK
jgi:hypothetical protein